MSDDANVAVRSTCSGDRLDCVSNQIEHDLLQLNTVAVDGWKIIGCVQLDMNMFRGRLRTYQRQRFFQHASRVDGADMRAAATEKITHVAHHAGGVIDMGNQGRQIAVSPRQVAAGRAQEMLCGSRECAGGRHRLVDLVRKRRGHAAHKIEACGLGCSCFLFLQTCLGLACEEIRALALAHDNSDDQSGRGKNQHEHLKFGERPRVVA